MYHLPQSSISTPLPTPNSSSLNPPFSASVSLSSPHHPSFSSRGLLSIPGYEAKHPQTEGIRELLAASATAMGRSDFSQPLKVLTDHWVENVSDLRLLIQEGLLREIGLPLRLCVWIEDELSALRPTHNNFNNNIIETESNMGIMATTVPFTPDSMSKPSQQPSSFALSPLFSRPDLQPRLFHYVSDMDTNGIIYALGSNFGSIGWTNPATVGTVAVTCSGLMKDSLSIDNVVGRSVVRCVTSADPNAFICIELKDVFVLPSAYTLRHYSSWDTECVRDWRLEGSKDAQQWVTLREHKGDTGIGGIGSTCTWKIQLDLPVDPSNPHASPTAFMVPSVLRHYYRFFRILLTGPNSNNHLYLACSGFELYGALLSNQAYHTLFTAASSVSSSLINLSQPNIPSAINTASKPSPHSGYQPIPSPASAQALPSGWAYEPTFNTLPNGYPPITVQHNNNREDVDMKQSAFAYNTFTYRFDFDTNGVIYAIATNNNTTPWVNPAEAGLVRVSASSVLEDSVSLSAVVGLDVVRCVTQPKPFSWMCLDLIDKTLICTAYSLRHYSSWDIEALRSWRFEGSRDGKEWVLLKEHKNDESLDAKGKTATWWIDQRLVNDVPCRYFRILQTAENSNKHHYLACSGWEMYGTVLAADGQSEYVWKTPSQQAAAAAAATPAPVQAQPPPVFRKSASLSSASAASASPQPSPTRKPSSVRLTATDIVFPYQGTDFGNDGIIHYLATAGNTQAWTNPHLSGLVQVSCSSLGEESVGPEAIVGKQTVRFVTQNVPHSWISIDFLTRAVCPTAYTLRHYSSWDTECLRNWRLEGSNNGMEWDVLQEHVNDEALDAKGATHTWAVTASVFYRTFRILQLEENSNRHHYLACSGFELYGALRAYGKMDRDREQDKMMMDQTLVSPVPIPVVQQQQPQQQLGLSPMDVSSMDHVRSMSPSPRAAAASSLAAPLSVTAASTPPVFQRPHSVSAPFAPLPPLSTSHSNSNIINATPQQITSNNVNMNNTQGFTAMAATPSAASPSSSSSAFNFAPLQHQPTEQAAMPTVNIPTLLAASASLSMPASVAASSSSAAMSATAPIVSPSSSLYYWDPVCKGPFLSVLPASPSIVRNAGSADKWQMVRSQSSFSSGIERMAVKVVSSPATSNTWKFIIGVVPATIDCAGAKQWVGTGGSWGYISGTGGKCHNEAKTVDYGASYSAGDVIGIVLNFPQRTIEWWKNDEPQGIAYEDLTSPVHIAASLTAADSMLALVPFTADSSAPIDRSEAALAATNAANNAALVAGAPQYNTVPAFAHAVSSLTPTAVTYTYLTRHYQSSSRSCGSQADSCIHITRQIIKGNALTYTILPELYGACIKVKIARDLITLLAPRLPIWTRLGLITTLASCSCYITPTASCSDPLLTTNTSKTLRHYTYNPLPRVGSMRTIQ